eukprot:CAMPEP_0176362728 /NCGR_PEP_ID=MMETSP0126-20121128/18622_1 /TAXON_ID=141414 ORGANISM="Strombidinopsis acuminatum, Strain SPMC142" /NCGR_SAMPLE_ID=MMETSP0126 /ASSEMBLY_ACC=CAM_ASM_000229 /LENGTH=73 /DNA_ID=CAMNT_0017718743 /DNA_START=425 /DNA_END=646 /DNA_ORIENTATION=+
MVIGLKTSKMDLVTILIIQVQLMKVAGKIVFSMVTVKQLGLMDRNMTESTKKERSTVKVDCNGKMEAIMKVNS